jgi:hypothetical protein
MVKLDIKKQHMDLEVTDKWLQAKDHQLAAQHQQECEKEAHNLQMFHLHLQYQEAGAVGIGQFGAQQFGVQQFGDSDMPGGVIGSGAPNLRDRLYLPPFNS